MPFYFFDNITAYRIMIHDSLLGTLFGYSWLMACVDLAIISTKSSVEPIHHKTQKIGRWRDLNASSCPEDIEHINHKIGIRKRKQWACLKWIACCFAWKLTYLWAIEVGRFSHLPRALPLFSLLSSLFAFAT